MRHVTLTAASVALFLLAAPAFAAGDDEDNGDKGDNGGGITLTTPSPEAAIGLPALALGIGAIVYLRSRRRKAA